MIHPYTLIPGNCYFVLYYFDQKLYVPKIETYIYLEKEQGESGDYWCFQDPFSYFNKDDDTKPIFFNFDESMLSRIVELTELLNTLRELEGLHPIVKDDRPITNYPVELKTSIIEQLQQQV